MKVIFVVHIVFASVALMSGYIALYSAKGDVVHRKSGMLFVYTMLTMCVAGFTLAVGRDAAPAVNVPAAMLTSYLVVTSLTTVKPSFAWSRHLHIGAMILVLGVALVNLKFGLEAIANGGKRAGIPAFPFFLFGIIGLLASAGDMRLLRTGPLFGAPRIGRHLWRMTFALLIAAMSFFFGQAKVLPKAMRIPGLLALPVLAVLVTMLYWTWRVRVKRTYRRTIRVTA